MGKKKYKKLKKEIYNLYNEINDIHDAILTWDKKVNRIDDKVNHIDERTMALDNVKINKWADHTKQLEDKIKILMDRTSVDYGKPTYSEPACIQNVYNRMANRGATREELDSFRNLIHKYNALEYTLNKEDNGND